MHAKSMCTLSENAKLRVIFIFLRILQTQKQNLLRVGRPLEDQDKNKAYGQNNESIRIFAVKNSKKIKTGISIFLEGFGSHSLAFTANHNVGICHFIQRRVLSKCSHKKTVKQRVNALYLLTFTFQFDAVIAISHTHSCYKFRIAKAESPAGLIWVSPCEFTKK